MINRLETDFGDDGSADPPGRLKAFSAFHRFDGRTWGITVWARDWQDAAEYCARHNLKLDGLIIGRIVT